MLTFAFGEMGLMPDDFYALTWNQYILKCQGFLNKERKEWERIGWATWNGMRVHVQKGMPSYKKFMSFLYQDEQVKDIDQIKELMRKATQKYLDNARN